MSTIPDDPNALLTRDQAAKALTESGFPIKPKTLATKATRGGGPPYRLFCARALYRWGEALAWAESRMSAPRCSTSEADTTRTVVAGPMPNGETPASNAMYPHGECTVPESDTAATDRNKTTIDLVEMKQPTRTRSGSEERRSPAHRSSAGQGSG